MKKLLILFIILVILGIGGYIFYKEGSLPVDKTAIARNNDPCKGSQIFVIKQGESLDSIINNLAKEKLIRNRLVFYMIVRQKGIERKIQAGHFNLSPSMNAQEISQALTHGTLDVCITIPEGMRKEEMAEIISAKMIEAGKETGFTTEFNQTEFNKIANEGYLYPDTYKIPISATTQQITDYLTAHMDENYAKVAARAEAKGLSKHEVLTLASLVEREALGAADRQEIANIIYKRLVEDWPLQIDATIQYALGYQPAEKKWWTQRLTRNHYQSVKSPYNTYLQPGLPPGPIGAPRLETMEAVVKADPTTPYWFYYHDKNGKAYYAVELGEHENNAGN